MTQPVSIQPEVCEYVHLEDGLVWAIRPELVRWAKLHDIAPTFLLEAVMLKVPGILPAHLGRMPQKCWNRMNDLLEERMAHFECPSLKAVMFVAAGKRLDSTSSMHIEHCPFCQRDLRLLRSGFPHYQEFFVR